MNADALPEVVIALAALLGMVGSILALFYRVGRLVGKVESAMTASSAADQRLDRDILSVKSSLDAHVALHNRGRWRR